MALKVRLDEICDSKISTISSEYSGQIEYIDISSVDNVQKKIISSQFFDAREAPSRAKQLIRYGDILVSMVRPNLNAVALVQKESNQLLVASTGYCILRCKSDVNNRYLFYFCQSPTFIDALTAQATGASYPAVNSSIIKNCLIPLPPLEIQERIATTFDRVSGLISLRKQQLAKLDELVKARFVEMFGDPIDRNTPWAVTTFGEQFLISSGGTPVTNDHSYWDGGTIPWIGSNLCQNEVLYCNDGKFITQTGLNHSSAKMLKSGTVLVALVGATIGKVALLSFETTTNQNIAAIDTHDNSGFTPEYVFYLLKFLYPKFQEIGGGKFKMANLAFIKTLPLNQPPVDLQNKFSAFLWKIEKNRLTIRQGLDKLEMLKKALMQECFGGGVFA